MYKFISYNILQPNVWAKIHEKLNTTRTKSVCKAYLELLQRAKNDLLPAKRPVHDRKLSQVLSVLESFWSRLSKRERRLTKSENMINPLDVIALSQTVETWKIYPNLFRRCLSIHQYSGGGVGGRPSWTNTAGVLLLEKLGLWAWILS